MVEKISIKNFKSIKDLEFDAKKINLFIGKPNTGKSNILEALGMFSLPYLDQDDLRFFIRAERVIDLFFDNQTSQRIEIKGDNISCQVWSEGDVINAVIQELDNKVLHLSLDANWNILNRQVQPPLPNFKFYRYRTLTTFPRKEFDFLLPPDGKNLLTILSSNENIYNLVNNLLEEDKLEIVLEEAESKIKILKKTATKPILHPYASLSDTFQRIIFYLCAIKSNKNSILIFEEPEAHSFPYYTKILAETVVLDNSNNQYFISTHNPYFVLSILEKTPIEQLAVFITYLENFQTKINELSEEQKEEILEGKVDVFFNIERFLEK